MSIDLVRDPARRMGGSALIRLDGSAQGESRVVLRCDDGALTLGPHGWAGAEHGFGPYPVERDARGAFLRIGPEIVNQMEAYLPVEVALPELGLREMLAWPDEILPAPGAFEGGGVGVSAPPKPQGGRDLSGVRDTPPAAKAPTPTPVEPEPEPEPERYPVDEAATADSQPVPVDPQRRSPLLWLAPLLLLVAAATGWWAWSNGMFAPQEVVVVPGPEPDPAPEPEPEPERRAEPTPEPVVPPPPEPVDYACAAEDLTSAAAAGLEALWMVADDCADVDRALERDALGLLIERGEGEAMRRWGALLDPWARPDDSPLRADAADAAVNYKKALAAGAAEAQADLDALCAELRADGNPMSRPLVAIHCE